MLHITTGFDKDGRCPDCGDHADAHWPTENGPACPQDPEWDTLEEKRGER